MIDIGDVLKNRDRKLETIGTTESIMDAIQRFGGLAARLLVVTEGDRLVGVVSVRDLLRHIGEHGAEALEQAVSEAMTREVTTVTPDTRLDAAAKLFADSPFNHLPVLDGDAVVGVVTPADVLRTHLGHVQDEAGYLRDYIAGVYY